MAAAVVRNVFVYGSLLAPEVLSALLHRVPRSSLAIVQDHHRYSIKDRIYPAVLPCKGDNVFGKVLFDLNDEELHILDEFEDIEYNKLIVSCLILNAHDVDGKVVDSAPNDGAQEFIGAGCLEQVGHALTLSNRPTDNMTLKNNKIEISPGRIIGLSLESEVTAYMYVWANQRDPNLVGNWNYEVWRTNQLEKFLAQYTPEK